MAYNRAYDIFWVSIYQPSIIHSMMSRVCKPAEKKRQGNLHKEMRQNFAPVVIQHKHSMPNKQTEIEKEATK